MLSSYRKLLRNESYVNVEDSFIHVFFVWLLVPRTRAGFRKLPKSFKRFQFRQAVVQQSRRENISRTSFFGPLFNGLLGLVLGYIITDFCFQSSMFLHFSSCTDYAFSLGVPCQVPCLFVILLSWPFCLFVFPFLLACLFCFFHFGSICAPSVFCSAVL